MGSQSCRDTRQMWVLSRHPCVCQFLRKVSREANDPVLVAIKQSMNTKGKQRTQSKDSDTTQMQRILPNLRLAIKVEHQTLRSEPSNKTVGTREQRHCRLLSSAIHHLYQCSKLRDMSADEKLKYIKEHRFCSIA